MKEVFVKPTISVPQEMVNNKESQVFNNDFFRRFNLRHSSEPIKLTDAISKNYLFPTFYGDVTCAMAIFLCSYNKTEKMLAKNLHHKIKPVKITRGRSIIAFSCYQYKNVMNVAPYNEIAMAIPIMVNGRFTPPLLPMVVGSFKHFGYYIAGMPVTSYENQLRGNNIWGLPKVTQEISIETSGSDCITTAYEVSGEPYITITVPTTGKATEFDERSNLYSKLNSKLLQSETNFKATFNVIKHMDLLFKKGAKPDREYIKIGDTESSRMLRDLEIEEHPFQFRYAEHMSSCFDLPNEETESWFREISGRE